MNNIPEFTSEIWKGNELKLKQKMIVGQPSWPTPMLAASMQFVIFHPDWGMPDGIKMKELCRASEVRPTAASTFLISCSAAARAVARVFSRPTSSRPIKRPSGRCEFRQLEQC